MISVAGFEKSLSAKPVVLRPPMVSSVRTPRAHDAAASRDVPMHQDQEPECLQEYQRTQHKTKVQALRTCCAHVYSLSGGVSVQVSAKTVGGKDMHGAVIAGATQGRQRMMRATIIKSTCRSCTQNYPRGSARGRGECMRGWDGCPYRVTGSGGLLAGTQVYEKGRIYLPQKYFSTPMLFYKWARARWAQK